MIRNPAIANGLGSSHFARRYFENRCFFLLLRVLRCFSSPRSLLNTYGFSIGWLHITAAGFPHSDICGSMDICSLPQLFAAYHVLRRLLVPRHPPYALIHLTYGLSLLLSASLLSFPHSLTYLSTCASIQSWRALHKVANPAPFLVNAISEYCWWSFVKDL